MTIGQHFPLHFVVTPKYVINREISTKVPELCVCVWRKGGGGGGQCQDFERACFSKSSLLGIYLERGQPISFLSKSSTKVIHIVITVEIASPQWIQRNYCSPPRQAGGPHHQNQSRTHHQNHFGQHRSYDFFQSAGSNLSEDQTMGTGCCRGGCRWKV